jgi:hypothetical protein
MENKKPNNLDQMVAGITLLFINFLFIYSFPKFLFFSVVPKYLIFHTFNRFISCLFVMIVSTILLTRPVYLVILLFICNPY